MGQLIKNKNLKSFNYNRIFICVSYYKWCLLKTSVMYSRTFFHRKVILRLRRELQRETKDGIVLIPNEIECARCAMIKCAMKTAKVSRSEQDRPIEMQRMRKEIWFFREIIQRNRPQCYSGSRWSKTMIKGINFNVGKLIKRIREREENQRRASYIAGMLLNHRWLCRRNPINSSNNA